MKKIFSCKTILARIVFVVILLSGSAALAWDGSTHAYLAKNGLGGGYICKYWARVGAMSPDFAWYLEFRNLISTDEAIELHDYLSNDLSLNDLSWWLRWDRRYKYFVNGAISHGCADYIADETLEEWIPTLGDLINSDDNTLHLSLEFAVGSLVVDNYGLQIADLLFVYEQSKLVETLAKKILGNSLSFNARAEFTNYMTLMRILEKIALVYAPYLKGEIDNDFISQIDIAELLSVTSVLSGDSIADYSEVMKILLAYPDYIYETITGVYGDDHWEDVLDEADDICF